MHTAGTTTGVLGGNSLMKKILAVLIIIIIVVFTISVIFSGDDDDKKPSTSSKPETTQSQPTIIKVGKVKTTYRFSEYSDRIIRVSLKSDAEFYPKGGVIKITNPNGGWWLDTPGTSITRPTSGPGVFTCEIPEDSDAWGVEIWN